MNKDMTPDEIKQEIIKCRESRAYYYNKYFKVPGSRDITDEEIVEAEFQMSMLNIKPRTRISAELYQKLFKSWKEYKAKTNEQLQSH